jgi:hypothetical protein
MKFSRIFKIEYSHSDDWFDPILVRDTKLFVDPFLIFRSQMTRFRNAHTSIISFFNERFKIAASSNKDVQDVRYRNLHHTLLFPEVEEICLGYAGDSIDGLGSGRKHAKSIVEGIYESIERGIITISHFEELGIFKEGIGCDLISDITVNLLKPDLVKYTQDICREKGVSLSKCHLRHACFYEEHDQWQDKYVDLPLNPFKKDRGIILVPKEFLRELPTINPDDFFDYCWDNRNEELRDQFSIEIKSKVDKKTIIDIAKKHREWVNEYEKSRDSKKPRPYDFLIDPRGCYLWHDATAEYASKNPLPLNSPSTTQEFISCLEAILKKFQNFIENHNGWKLLWNEKKKDHKSEEAAQILFFGIAKAYCDANNIDISKEVNLGRGPVDFKFSSGYIHKALLEVKLANNTKFWNGLTRQLPKYLEAEDCLYGFFMVVIFSEKESIKIGAIDRVVADFCRRKNHFITPIIIDARFTKPSASKL